MGGANSQPSYRDLQAHLSYTNSVNNAYFHELKLMNSSDRNQLLNALRNKCETIYPVAEEYIASLNGQIGRAEERLGSLGEEVGVKLVMEVRKGIEILPFGLQACKGVYVKVQVAPANLEFQTRLAEPYIPKWYHVAYLTYSPPQDVLNALLTIYSVDLRNQEVAIASCEMDLREAIDTTQTRWHAFKWLWSYGDQSVIPQVEIRYWNLKSMQAFWENYQASAMTELEEIQGAYERSMAASLPFAEAVSSSS